MEKTIKISAPKHGHFYGTCGWLHQWLLDRDIEIYQSSGVITIAFAKEGKRTDVAFYAPDWVNQYDEAEYYKNHIWCKYPTIEDGLDYSYGRQYMFVNLTPAAEKLLQKLIYELAEKLNEFIVQDGNEV